MCSLSSFSNWPIQRWNHHRISTDNIRTEPLGEVTDDAYFGVCARCQMEQIYEADRVCKKCHNDLGPISYFLQPLSPAMLPLEPEIFGFVTFECAFLGPTGCVYQGKDTS